MYQMKEVLLMNYILEKLEECLRKPFEKKRGIEG